MNSNDAKSARLSPPSSLTNMIVGQSFSTKIEIFEGAEFLFVMSSSGVTLEMQVKCVVSDFDVTSELHSEKIFNEANFISLSPQHSSFMTNMTVGQSFSTKLDVFIVQSFLTKLAIFEVQSFSS